MRTSEQRAHGELVQDCREGREKARHVLNALAGGRRFVESGRVEREGGGYVEELVCVDCVMGG